MWSLLLFWSMERQVNLKVSQLCISRVRMTICLPYLQFLILHHALTKDTVTYDRQYNV
jgi:hypothetical protein